MNLLTSPLITASAPIHPDKARRSLPGTLAALVRGEVGDFPRLRPHQRHVWHALLVQLAVLVLVLVQSRAGAGWVGAGGALPDTEGAWRDGLLALTPDEPDHAAWSLVAPPDRPAFLQAPLPGGDLGGFKSVDGPDELDVLIMSKNHDLKRSTLPVDDAELWLYALVSLQTQEGFLGAGNYGIARMNGGFASRPALSVLSDGAAAASLRFTDDVRRCLAQRPALLKDYPYPAQGGIALLWLAPWDGKSSLALSACDPFFIEICRRVRLIATPAGLSARAAPSKAARIDAKASKGNTGDPWTPLIRSKDDIKAFTADDRGWSYAQLVKLLFPRASSKGEEVIKAPLQTVDGLDPMAELAVLGRVLVRGQGKTEGYYERRVPISALVSAGFWRTKPADPLAELAHGRVADIATFADRVLSPAVMAVCAGAPRTDAGERARDDPTTKERAKRLCAGFDQQIDESFFGDLTEEAACLDDPVRSQQVRMGWICKRLFPIGEQVVTAALTAAPDAALRHWRVRVQAHELFKRCFDKKFDDRLKAAQIRDTQSPATPRAPKPIYWRIVPMSDGAPPEASARPVRKTRAQTLTTLIAALRPGESAALRRRTPTELLSDPVFHRTMFQAGFRLEEIGLEEATDWAVLVHAIALIAHALSRREERALPAGEAMADAGLSEARFAKLMAARGQTLRDQITVLARYLAAKQSPIDWRELALLLCVDRKGDAAKLDVARYRIARTYYVKLYENDRKRKHSA